MAFFRLLAHEIAACKRAKEDYEIDRIRLHNYKICSWVAVEIQA